MDIRYIAGFFDGEGCITAVEVKRNSVVVSCRVSNTDIRVLKTFLNKFGGHIYTDKRSYNNGGFLLSCWMVSSQKARNFLEKI